MSQEVLINPQGFVNGPAQAFAALDPSAESLSDGIGSSYGVVHYKGKNWTLRYRGETFKFIRADDGTPSPFLDIVILQQSRHKSKSYFGKWDPKGGGGRPLCTSLDGVVPDLGVPEKQSDTCALCPQNEWKTNAEGRRGKACQDYKRLAVLLMPAQTKIMQNEKTGQKRDEPLVEPVFFRVPPASLVALGSLGDDMKRRGYHFSSYITRVSFDDKEAHPKMVFRAQQALDATEAPFVLQLRNDPLCQRVIGDAETVGPADASPFAVSTPAAKQSAVLNLSAVEDIANVNVPDALTVDEAKTEGVHVPDTGEPTASDADLDARIAAMMPTK